MEKMDKIGNDEKFEKASADLMNSGEGSSTAITLDDVKGLDKVLQLLDKRDKYECAAIYLDDCVPAEATSKFDNLFFVREWLKVGKMFCEAHACEHPWFGERVKFLEDRIENVKKEIKGLHEVFKRQRAYDDQMIGEWRAGYWTLDELAINVYDIDYVNDVLDQICS